MNSNTVHQGRGPHGAYLQLPVPIRDPGAFSHDATADVLHLLVDNPERSFTNRELHRVTGKGLGNVNGAVRALESLGIITVERDGRANSVRLDPERTVLPDDPILTIPQAEFHDPVRTIVAELNDRIVTEAGIVLFGSVARGDADRASDIDLFVVVPEDRMAGLRAAHAIEDDIGSRRFDGDRYEPHIVVETRRSAITHDRIRTVLTEGLTLQEAPALAAVKEAVVSDGT